MAIAALFDTLQFAKKAEEAGFTKLQAEFQAEEMAKIIDENLATKEDILGIKRDILGIKRDIFDVKRDIKEAIDKVTIRFGSMLAAAVIMLPVLIKLIDKI